MNLVGVVRAAAPPTTIKPIAEKGFPFPDIDVLVRNLLLLGIIGAGFAAFIFLILGGFQYITSGGDKAQAEMARDKITYAIIGLVIIVAAYAIAKVLETVFGVAIVSGVAFPQAPGSVAD